MKKFISLVMSAVMLVSSVAVGTVVQAETGKKIVDVASGQRMTYVAEKGDYYKVTLYNELPKGKYEEKETGYIFKSDVNTTYMGNYGRPWTDPNKAIYYGAKYIAKGYLTYQYTMYLQKFNVNVQSGNLYKHEYMTNVNGAASESNHLYSGYAKAGLLNNAHTFYIPVFNNMPNDNPISTASPVAEALRTAGFPDSYINSSDNLGNGSVGLEALQNAHPNWKFVAFNTGLDFEEAVKGELAGTPTTEEHLRDYLDPRNWLNEKYVFQFESIKKSDAVQSVSSVNAILKNTWMANSKITYLDTMGNSKTVDEVDSYADAMIKASNDTNLSANYIAAKIRQENGGTSNSATAVCGKKEPFKGIYNYFNIGAYVTASDGLAWAAGFLKASRDTALYDLDGTETTAPTITTKNYTPAKVKLTSLTAQSGHKIKAKWNKCSTSATGYQIYWAKDKKFKKVVAKTTTRGRSKVTYTGKNFTKGRKYYVRIRAYKKAGGKTYYGPWSNIKAKTSK